MNILIYGINFAPELTGIGKYTGEMAAYLRNKGHHLEVITAPPYYPQWRVAPSYASWRYCREFWRDINVFRCPLWVPKKQTGFKRILHLFSFVLSSAPLVFVQATRKPDVILMIAPTLFSAPVTLLASWLTGAKSWLHIQDFEIDAALGLDILPIGSLFTSWLKTLETWLYQCFDHVSTISPRMMARLWEKGVPAYKTRLFPNWIDTEVIYPLSESGTYRKELGFFDGEVVVQYAGNMGVKHGLEVLVESAKILTEESRIKFVLCGDGVALHGLKKRTSGMSNIYFIPLQPQERLNELLNFADIHILPQRPDAADLVMPSKLTGMLASGKPVIATAAPDTQIAQVIKRVGLVVQPGDSFALANAIRRLASDQKLRKNLGSKGRDYVIEHWEKRKVLSSFNVSLKELVDCV